MEKKSFNAAPIKGALELVPLGAKVLGVGVAGSFALKSIVNKVNNDAQCKRLIEDLALNDPILKTVDKGTLIEWYASMYNVAPTLAKDRQTVTETLRNFARFNKIDMNTLKLLADTESSVVGSRKNSSAFGSFGTFFK